MNSGKTSPATNSGIPKMRPMLVPFPSVRLIINPAMNRINPSAMAKEKI